MRKFCASLSAVMMRVSTAVADECPMAPSARSISMRIWLSIGRVPSISVERFAELADDLGLLVLRDVEHGERLRGALRVLLAQLRAPVERLDQRRQRARVAHLEHQLEDVQARLRVLGVVVIRLHERLGDRVRDRLHVRVRAVALVLAQLARVEAREVGDGVLAPHRVLQLLRLTDRIVRIPRDSRRRRCR